MDNDHLGGELDGFDADETVDAPSEVTVTLFAFVCFSTLTLMALTERFGELPAASGGILLGVVRPPSLTTVTRFPDEP